MTMTREGPELSAAEQAYLLAIRQSRGGPQAAALMKRAEELRAAELPLLGRDADRHGHGADHVFHQPVGEREGQVTIETDVLWDTYFRHATGVGRAAQSRFLEVSNFARASAKAP